jgi:hypothetical protein
MKYTTLTIMLIISFCSVVFSQENTKQQKHFKVETVYPDGKQTSFGGTLKDIWVNPNGVNTEKYTFSNSHEEVWSAAKRAAEKFSRIGKRPINIEEDKGRISNSNIEEARNRRPALIQTTWVDEIITEVTYIDENHTKVAVSRKVLEIQTDTRRNKVWANVASNGKIERWILTQIENEINKGASGSTREDNSNNNNAQRNRKFIVQSGGFTFVLEQCKMSGGIIVCYFTVTSNDLDRELEQFGCYGSCSPKMVDNSGNEHGIKSITIGNKRWKANLVANVATKMILTSEDFNPSASEIALLQVNFRTGNTGIKLSLRSIPIMFDQY